MRKFYGGACALTLFRLVAPSSLILRLFSGRLLPLSAHPASKQMKDYLLTKLISASDPLRQLFFQRASETKK